MKRYKFLLALLGICMPGMLAFAAEPYAQVRVSVANIREARGHASEMGSQVIMGTPLKVESQAGNGWLKVTTPEGYEGFIAENTTVPMSEEAFNLWKSANRFAVVSVDQAYVYAPGSRGDMTARQLRRCRVTDIVDGSILEADYCGECDSTMVGVRLPDGRRGLMFASDVAPLEQWAAREPDFDAVIDFAIAMMGTPYLWGGTSSKGMDCSGLTKIAFLSQGVVLPRNASQQARIGMPVDIGDLSALRRGDLLFFGNSATGRVNHVGIYIGDGRFIHCSGRVKINSLIASEPDYTPLSLLSVRRLSNADMQSLGVSAHPWYFNR